MIALICGKIAYKGISSIVVDVSGVGYRVFIPLTTFYELPEAGEPVTLHVHTHVKEDAINLFGFYTIQERDLFQLLISVSGIGPKIAMSIISGIAVHDLLQAISRGDVGKAGQHSRRRQENGRAPDSGAQRKSYQENDARADTGCG